MRPEQGYYFHMTFDWGLLLCVLGLAMILEGVPYFLWSEKMPEVLRYLAQRPPSALRRLGLTAIIAGLVLVMIGRQF